MNEQYEEMKKKGRITRGFWNIDNNKNLFLNWIGKKLGYKTFEDWYKINREDIRREFGGIGLLSNHYRDSAIKYVIEMFPEHDFKEWKFKYAPQGFWNNINNQKKYIIWLLETTKKDLIQINRLDFEFNCGNGLIDKYFTKNSKSKLIVYNIINECFPGKIKEQDYIDNFNINIAKRQTLSKKEYLKTFEELDYIPISKYSEYSNNSCIVRYQCKKCSYKGKSIFANMRANGGCKGCANRLSDDYVKSFFESKNCKLLREGSKFYARMSIANFVI